MGIQDLPAVNATLNALSAVFLSAGYLFIRNGRQRAHQRCMLAALATSTVFLACYVVYHANVGSRPFGGQGTVRLVYFTILVTHVVLAALVVPLALVTAIAGAPAAPRRPRPHRPLDAADLALRLGDRRRHLPDAVLVVVRGFSPGFQAAGVL